MKTNQLMFVVALIGSCFMSQINAAVVSVKVTVKVGVTTCVGEKSQCGTTINAIGEPEIIDIKKYPKTTHKLNKITEFRKNELIQLPLKPESDPTIYVFTPTEGELANKEILLAFDNIEPRLGSLYSGKNYIRLHRRVPSIEPRIDQWSEVGKIVTDKQIDELPMDISPDGTWSIFSTEKDKSIDIKVGQKNIQKAAEKA